MVSQLNPVAERSSPFADCLRAAIDARDLTLGRIAAHLLARGVRVSVATLSYWQSGRSHPERRASQLAVKHLEEILRVAPRTLTELLDQPRRRGRSLIHLPIGALWPHPDQIEDATSQVDTEWDDRLTRISHHDRLIVGPDRDERSTVSRQVLRASADGPDRWVVIVHLDAHDGPLPLVRPLRHCHLGRVVHKPEAGLIVAELLFDTPLRRGETIITEHELVTRAPYPPAGNYERKFRMPVREYVVEVCFDAAAVPAHCEQYTVTETGEEVVRQVQVGDRGTVHGVALDFGPGCYGFRWQW
ncbi:hypothetical protein SAMN05192558_110284 [Actinokineospora alba]|uniref:Uncharacterized protein n=1 Tax=Actinokineospora alba TaxID=504798 RepID=A0A1H0TZ11_9PSEU|nr:transcriptional regulator [Actinokineospora alba]TDP70803.1 hypothetical protein C8E96_6432 [Actinokineospora alba]SDJ16899.1 hypothetical protein SAMN05421871_110284 [Actinokineospora alba]SDP59164.1 hypothetical protein SAMN05192558_110284 [Actinokineospora alba]